MTVLWSSFESFYTVDDSRGIHFDFYVKKKYWSSAIVHRKLGEKVLVLDGTERVVAKAEKLMDSVEELKMEK